MFTPRQHCTASVVDVGFFARIAAFLLGVASLIRMEFSKRAWYTQLNKTK